MPDDSDPPLADLPIHRLITVGGFAALTTLLALQYLSATAYATALGVLVAGREVDGERRRRRS